MGFEVVTIRDCTLYRGDCLEVLRELPAESVDSIVTDPPYGLEFMGQAWDRPWAMGKVSGVGSADGTPFRRNAGTPAWGASGNPTCINCGGDKYRKGPRKCVCDAPKFPVDANKQMQAFQAWCETWAIEAIRVLKPGGHLLAFGGTRTYHRMVCAIEDAGFEVRDQIQWIYGSGFPKSLDVSKAIDKAAGAEREVSGRRKHPTLTDTDNKLEEHANAAHGENTWAREWDITAPATEAAKQWNGWGTALKPAHEPIVVARKPLIGTVSENVLHHGTGAINVDDCRIATVETLSGSFRTDHMHGGNYGNGRNGEASGDRRYTESGSTNFSATPGPRGGDAKGRWPANVIHDGSDEVLQHFPDTASGQPCGIKTGGKLNVFGEYAGGIPISGFGDSGSAARFFYCAKASQDDRDDGLKASDRNTHPTVKPTDLMRYLLRLVTPPDGTALDCFMGSGSTGKAAIQENFKFIGIEQQQEYFEIACGRMRGEYGKTPLF